MAITKRVQIKGLRELGETLRAFGDEVVNDACRQATYAAALPIKQRAIELAPVAPELYEIEGVRVLPGNIGRNVIVRRMRPSQTTLTSEHVVTVRGGAKAGHAHRVASLQEWGTVNHAPHPFFRPAFETRRGAALAALRDSLRKGIARAARKARK